METWMLGPPLLIGDKVVYSDDSGALLEGSVRWLGRISPAFGKQLVVGVELDEAGSADGDGTYGHRRLFTCSKPRSGVFASLSRIRKANNGGGNSASVGSVDETPLSGGGGDGDARVRSLHVYVEDAAAHHGPLVVRVSPESTVRDLRATFDGRYGIDADRQTWIHRRNVLGDDGAVLRDLGLRRDGHRLYLIITQPVGAKKDDNKENGIAAAAAPAADDGGQMRKGRYWNYEKDRWSFCEDSDGDDDKNDKIAEAASAGPAKAPDAADELKRQQDLDNMNLVPNAEEFQCAVCFADVAAAEGVVLRECLHNFCKDCLRGTIEHSDGAVVKCPFTSPEYTCEAALLDREIRELVAADVYRRLEKKSMAEVQASDKTFACRTPDCEGWCFITDETAEYRCDVCGATNCVNCRAVHEGLDCKAYQESVLAAASADDENARKTHAWIEGLVAAGDALHCPSCEVLLLKKWGCDWVRCTYCRTEICWVTRGARWGPAGRGDTSGGCKCMLDGRTKCHPLCNYCH